MSRLPKLIGLFVAVSASLAGQSGDWLAVQGLQTGQRIEIRTTADPGRKIRGALRSTTTDRVVLVDKSGAERSYARPQIARVRLRRSDTAPIAGAVAGAAWGGLVAGISDGSAGQRIASIPIVASVGWLIGKGIQKGNWRTIYKAGAVP